MLLLLLFLYQSQRQRKLRPPTSCSLPTPLQLPKPCLSFSLLSLSSSLKGGGRSEAQRLLRNGQRTHRSGRTSVPQERNQRRRWVHRRFLRFSALDWASSPDFLLCLPSDSDSDSELSADEHSSSYASSHSSDSEDDDIDIKPKWNNERQPVHSTPKGRSSGSQTVVCESLVVLELPLVVLGGQIFFLNGRKSVQTNKINIYNKNVILIH